MGYNQLSYEDWYQTNRWVPNLRNHEWLICQFCHLFSGSIYTFANTKEQRYLSRL